MAKIAVGGILVNKALYERTAKAVSSLEDDTRAQLIAKVNDMAYVIPRVHCEILHTAGVVDASGDVYDKIVTILQTIFTQQGPASKPIRNAVVVDLKRAMEGSVVFK